MGILTENIKFVGVGTSLFKFFNKFINSCFLCWGPGDSPGEAGRGGSNAGGGGVGIGWGTKSEAEQAKASATNIGTAAPGKASMADPGESEMAQSKVNIGIDTTGWGNFEGFAAGLAQVFSSFLGLKVAASIPGEITSLVTDPAPAPIDAPDPAKGKELTEISGGPDVTHDIPDDDAEAGDDQTTPDPLVPPTEPEPEPAPIPDDTTTPVVPIEVAETLEERLRREARERMGWFSTMRSDLTTPDIYRSGLY